MKIELTSEPPAMRSCFHWTLAGEPLTLPPDGGCQLPGDIDCDGGVDAVDGLNDLRHVAGLGLNLPNHCEFRGDVNCDGKVDVIDALMLLRHVAGMPVSLHDPCAAIGAWPGNP